MATRNSNNRIQKITISKSDEVALVVEKLIDSGAKELILNIPRFSRLAESLANFHLISREAKLLRKKIVIESVDDKVIELAGLADLESLNPILLRSRRQFYDIVSAKRSEQETEDTGLERQQLVETVKSKPPRAGWSWKPQLNKKFLWGGVGLAIVLLIFVFSQSLARAEIKIITNKIPWQYNDSIRTEKNAMLDTKNSLLPAQVFTQKSTLKLSFPATGKKNVQQRAGGKIIVYNAYSSEPQSLVATTRFVAPDGKVFRLSKNITVPGAKITDGKVVPSSIEADVIADKAGPDYNIGPVTYFSIPGFKGTPKYQGFYGESKAAMTGGFVGEVAYPTDADIKSAKSNMGETVSSALKEKALEQIPKEFSVIEGAAGFSILSQKVDDKVDENKNFSISVEAQIVVIAFKETDLLTVMESRVEQELKGDFILKDYNIQYGQARADFIAGRLSFPVAFTASVSKFVDPENLKKQVLGKSEGDLRAIINGLADLQSAEISLWPFWVGRVPSDASKIKIIVD